MKEEELRKAYSQYSALLSAKQRLEKAERDLKAFNNAKPNMIWKPNLVLQKAEYGRREVSVTIEIPYGVIQQQLVYAYNKAKREVIALGGEL